MSILVKGILLIAVGIASTATAAALLPPPAAEYYRETAPGAANLLFSEAVRVGHMLYPSGAIGTDESGELVAGGMAAEAEQTMDNISAVLKRRSSGIDQVVQCTVALADIVEVQCNATLRAN
jgi:enamine deaminase RidA (YjgF/YER057c/UK114 family)